jgi:hypothetical protein
MHAALKEFLKKHLYTEVIEKPKARSESTFAGKPTSIVAK